MWLTNSNQAKISVEESCFMFVQMFLHFLKSQDCSMSVGSFGHFPASQLQKESKNNPLASGTYLSYGPWG